MTSDVFCRVFIDNGQDVFHEEKFGQVTLLNTNKGSKSFLLKRLGIDIVLRTKIRELLVAILDYGLVKMDYGLVKVRYCLFGVKKYIFFLF